MESSRKPATVHLRSYKDVSAWETCVFWNMVECPIPEDMNVGSVVSNIKDALKDAGFNGAVAVNVYTNSSNYPKAFDKALLVPHKLPKGDADEKGMFIISGLLGYALVYGAPKNILLIMEDIEGRDEFIRVFELVRRKEFNCMLAQVVDSPVLRHETVDTAWLWKDLARGGSALPRAWDTDASSSQ